MPGISTAIETTGYGDTGDIIKIAGKLDYLHRNYPIEDTVLFDEVFEELKKFEFNNIS